MARSLDFIIEGQSFACELNTIDRSKLYGSVSTQTKDMEGRRCSLATLAVDGKTLIPFGGTAAGYVNTDGDWIPRKKLKAVSPAGEDLPEVASSFDQPVELSRVVTAEEFLDHSIRLLYLLGYDTALPATFLSALAEGKIFRFEFSYRGGVDADPAFILMDEAQKLWMLVAEDTDIQFVGLEQAAVCVTTADIDTDEADEESELDFGML